MDRVKANRLLFAFCKGLLVTVAIAFITGNLQAQEPASLAPLVKLNLIVTDKANRAIDDIRLEDINVSEGGKPQTVTLFSRNISPVIYCLMIDTSRSFLKLLPATIDMAKLIVNSNRPTDETCLIRFIGSNKIETVDDFTSDKAALIKDLSLLKAEEGQSAVIDAVYVGARHVGERNKDVQRRRVLLLISDGEDRASFYSEKDLIKVLRQLDVQIFVIGVLHLLSDEGGLIRKSPRVVAQNFLMHLAEETGGRVFFPKTDHELLDAAEQIIHDLHMQYTIGYVPLEVPRKESFHEVKVRLADSPSGGKRIAITRPGYSIKSEDKKPKQ